MIPFPNISPEIFTISLFGFDFSLRWYALAYIIGILLAWRIAIVAVRKPTLWRNNTPPLDPNMIEDLVSYAILGVIFGGRLGYVFFYQPSYYLANPLEIIQVWQGGMSFHGGLLGVIIAAYIYFRRTYTPLLSGADMIALSVPAGLLLGRMANFINAELWGRETTLPWGVIFPGDAAQTCANAAYGLCARHPSQLYEAILEGLILGTILIFLAYRQSALKFPGRIMGVFFMSYGLSRFIVEFVRQPDAQFVTDLNPIGYAIQFGEFGATMGQLLSIPMILLGAFFVIRSLRKTA